LKVSVSKAVEAINVELVERGIGSPFGTIPLIRAGRKFLALSILALSIKAGSQVGYSLTAAGTLPVSS